MRTAGALLASALWLAAGTVASEGKSAADYYVRSLPGLPKDIALEKMHAGHIEIDATTNANLFFWHVQNKHIADKPRTVIWLNGGPGCSSMDGALMEVGPYRLTDDHTLTSNNGSWHEFANLLFVDQPVGTGFSYVDTDKYLHELPEMAAHFMIFLDKFFKIFPEYEDDDIYIAGESYAGQHIPYIAQAILDRNKKINEHESPWKVAGLLIGNGWIDPLAQYDSYLPFAYQSGILAKDSQLAKVLETQRALCTKTLSDNGIHVDVRECEMVLTSFLDKSRHKGRGGQGDNACFNMYDVRLDDTYPDCGMNWPPDVHFMKPYLRRKDVIQALHVNPDKRSGWTECSGAVGSAFRAQNSKPSVELLPGLLKEMPILLFNGDKDLICNHVGTGTMIQNMAWNNGKGFEVSPGVLAPREDWVFEGQPAGTYQTARNLTYVTFYNASHMVPYDFPRRSREMLDKFMQVNIGPIGGKPAESVIGGHKGPINSVGGTPNSTEAEHKVKEKLEKAKWDAYYHSGEIALIFVASAAAIWGIFICRQRRRRSRARALRRGGKGVDSTTRLEEGFEDNELGDIANNTTERVPIYSASAEDPMPGHRYSLGGVSSDEDSDDEDSKSKLKVEKPNGTTRPASP